MRKLPKLSHLQFLVLGVLQRGVLPGREVRKALAAAGRRIQGPAFYQLMTRMEDAGFVLGDYQQQVIEGQIIRERRYELTSKGADAWNRSCQFYLGVMREFGPGTSPASA